MVWVPPGVDKRIYFRAVYAAKTETGDGSHWRMYMDRVQEPRRYRIKTKTHGPLRRCGRCEKDGVIVTRVTFAQVEYADSDSSREICAKCRAGLDEWWESSSRRREAV